LNIRRWERAPKGSAWFCKKVWVFWDWQVFFSGMIAVIKAKASDEVAIVAVDI